MSQKIQSKIHNYGSKNESSWPPKYPPKSNAGRFYWDKEAQEFKEGNPPNPNNQFGTAPMVIFDSMPPQFHEGACRTIESRKEWELENKAHGMATFSSMEAAKPKRNEQAEKKKKKEEYRRASIAAMETVRSNPRYVRQKLEKQGEQQMAMAKEIGLDKTLKEIGAKD